MIGDTGTDATDAVPREDVRRFTSDAIASASLSLPARAINFMSFVWSFVLSFIAAPVACIGSTERSARRAAASGNAPYRGATVNSASGI